MKASDRKNSGMIRWSRKMGFFALGKKVSNRNSHELLTHHKEKTEHFVSYNKDKSHGYIWYTMLEFSSIMKSNISKQEHCDYPVKY